MSAHRIELVSSFLEDGWTAHCSCGWIGQRQNGAAEASADGDGHRAEAQVAK